MKLIAIPVLNNNLSAHFGHAPHFFIYQVSGKDIIKQRMLQSPPHTPGAIPHFLGGEGVTDVIVSGIGQKAIEIFNSQGINVYSGAEPDTPDTIIRKFIKDQLVLTANTCDSDHHDHNHDCNHDHDCNH